MAQIYIVVRKSVVRCVTSEGHFPSFSATETSQILDRSKIDVTCISLILARLNYSVADQCRMEVCFFMMCQKVQFAYHQQSMGEYDQEMS